MEKLKFGRETFSFVLDENSTSYIAVLPITFKQKQNPLIIKSKILLWNFEKNK